MGMIKNTIDRFRTRRLIRQQQANYVKAVTDRSKLTSATFSLFDLFGAEGAKPQPFDYRAAVAANKGWVYRCVTGNATRAAATPLRMFARTGSRAANMGRTRTVATKAIDRLCGPSVSPIVREKAVDASLRDGLAEVTEHPLLDLLRSANPLNNGYDLSVHRFTSLQLTGNAYVHVIMDDAMQQPTELWPLQPQWVWIVPGGESATGVALETIREALDAQDLNIGVDDFEIGDDDDLRDALSEIVVAGYVFGTDPLNLQTFATDEILHWRWSSVSDTLYGMGPTEAAWSIIAVHTAHREMQQAIFANRGRPDAIVAIKGQADPTAVDRLKEEIRQQHQGTKKAGRLLVGTGDIDVTTLTSDLDLGTDESVLEELAGIYGYPIVKLKGAFVPRANTEQADVGWLRDTIQPMLTQDEQALNQNGLLALFGDGLVDDAFLAYDDPVPDDALTQRTADAQLVAQGLMTVNEFREEHGLGPMPSDASMTVQTEAP